MTKMDNINLNKIILKTIVLVMVVLLAKVPFTKAELYNDDEVSRGNFFSSMGLNIKFKPDVADKRSASAALDISEESWIPGSSFDKTYRIFNGSDLPYLYGLKYQNESNNDLCKSLETKVIYQWEEEKEDKEKMVYEGQLVDLDISHDPDNELFDHMRQEPADAHFYYIKIWLPIDVNEDLADESCDFDIVSYSWQEKYNPYEAYWDEEDLLNTVETKDWTKPQACEIDSEVFMIGDEEGDNGDNPANEFNWDGDTDKYPDYEDPFVVGTSEKDEFPWNSNKDKGYADDFEVKFFYDGEDALAKLTVSWAPGTSGTEKKEVYLDGDLVGETADVEGSESDGWWEKSEVVQEEFQFVLKNGLRVLNFIHPSGDGSYWDFVKLETEVCGSDKRDILINEVMWSGSGSSGEDEWIELYNNTDDEIDLGLWVIEGAGGADDFEIPEGNVISARGYFLISNYDSVEADSALSDTNVTVDLVSSDLDLENGGEKLILRDPVGNEIDKADGSGGWPAGEDGDTNRSMERNDVPETGWHSCINDECGTTDYWDAADVNYGTPRAENRSENDPSEKILESGNLPLDEDTTVEEENNGPALDEELGCTDGTSESSESADNSDCEVENNEEPVSEEENSNQPEQQPVEEEEEVIIEEAIIKKDEEDLKEDQNSEEEADA